MGAVPKPIHTEPTTSDQPSTDAEPEEQTFESLTAAEMRVLVLLPSHLTIGVIARQLYIAHSTAKSHSLSIYRKLKVCSRAAAVQRAIELEILPDVSDPAAAPSTGKIERSLRLVSHGSASQGSAQSGPTRLRPAPWWETLT